MRLVISLALLTGLVPVASFAENLSDIDCGTHTYAYYQANYNGVGEIATPCANGILNYSGFTFQSFGTPGALVTAEDITISAVGPPRFGLGDTGFTISGLSVAAGQTATYVLDWFFVIDPGPYAGGGRLGMDPPYGDVTFTQMYCVDAFMTEYTSTAGTSCIGSRLNDGVAPPVQTLTVTVPHPDDSIVFDPVATSFASVRTIIQLNGGENGSGYDFLLTGTQIYDSNVPEPGTIALIPAGLLVAGLLRKRITHRSEPRL